MINDVIKEKESFPTPASITITKSGKKIIYTNAKLSKGTFANQPPKKWEKIGEGIHDLENKTYMNSRIIIYSGKLDNKSLGALKYGIFNPEHNMMCYGCLNLGKKFKFKFGEEKPTKVEFRRYFLNDNTYPLRGKLIAIFPNTHCILFDAINNLQKNLVTDHVYCYMEDSHSPILDVVRLSNVRKQSYLIKDPKSEGYQYLKNKLEKLAIDPWHGWFGLDLKIVDCESIIDKI